MEFDVDDSGTAGRGEVMKLLIIIRGRWRTEGLAKEMKIVGAFEKGLPKWKGFVDIGWMDEVGP